MGVPFQRPRRARRRAASRATATRATCLVLVGLVMALVTGTGAGLAEEEEGGPIPVGDFKLLNPIRDQLGASAWLAVSGFDPRLIQIPTGEAARGVADWGAYGAPASVPLPRGAAFAPQVPFRSAAPAFSRNQIITRQLGLFPIQTEPNIAVDPFDPDHLVMGTIDYNFPSMSTYVSFDGGETWEGPNQVPYLSDDQSAAGDPVLAYDRDGNVYMVHISLGIEEYRIGSLASASEVSSMAVNKSTDGGLTWENTVSAARGTIETSSFPDESGRERGEVAVGFLDKPWMTIGPNPANPDQDVIYVVYTEFRTRYSLLYADELPFLTAPVTETTIRAVSSTDGGTTWSAPVAVSPTVFQAQGSSEPGEGGAGAETGATSQPAVAADVGGADAGEADAGGEETGIATPNAAVARSAADGSDADQDAQAPQAQQEPAEAPTQDVQQTVQGSQPAVLSDGTLVVTYLDTTTDGIQEGLATIMVATSTDGGQTFAEPIQAGVFREIHFRPRNSTFRWWGAAFPQLAVGPNDEIYIATTAQPPDKPTDDGDIYLMRSFDRGATWQEPVRLNQDDTDRIQFFPSIDVSPDGNVHAMWADMRDDPNEVRYNIYYSQSRDQGATWGFTDEQIGLSVPDTRVTDFASNSLRGFPGGRFLGDYFSLTAANEDVYMVWADTRLGEFAGPNQQIGFARRTQIAPPSLFLNPPSGAAGREVTLQGFAFQPDSNIVIDVGGVSITNLRSNENGEFTTTFFMPVTGEGARTVAAYDDTGNVATTTFFTDFGFDSIARALGELGSEEAAQAAQSAATPAPIAPLPGATPQAIPPIPAATPVADNSP